MPATRRRSQYVQRAPVNTKLAWSCQSVNLILPAASVGTGSQATQALGGRFVAITGEALRDVTISRVFIKGFAQETGTLTDINTTLELGMILKETTLDAGEFPDIGFGFGDYFVRDCRDVKEPSGVAPNTIMDPAAAGPNIGGVYDIDGKSKRRIGRQFEDLWIVGQKDTITNANVVMRLSVTILWKY